MVDTQIKEVASELLRPLVSVIILNYNYAQYLSKAIESVLLQTYPKIETIVVDNGSQDNSSEIIHEYKDSIKVVSHNNLGQAAGRNSGIKVAKGEFLAFLDADDYWATNKIEKQIHSIDSAHQLSYTGINIVDENDSLITTQLPRFSGLTDLQHIKTPGVSIVLSGESSALISSSLIHDLGYFDSNLSSGSGWDLFRRCSRKTRFAAINEPLTFRRIHPSNASKNVKLNIEEIQRCYIKLFQDPEWLDFAHLQNRTQRRLKINAIKSTAKQRLSQISFKRSN